MLTCAISTVTEVAVIVGCADMLRFNVEHATIKFLSALLADANSVEHFVVTVLIR